MSASLDLGEDVFARHGLSMLVPSRPGYGRTPVAAGPTAEAFADRTAELCGRLGVRQVVAVGISAGSRTALTLAARHSGLVQAVVLVCPLSFAPWPDPRTRRAARVLFHPVAEGFTWALVRLLLRVRNAATLTLMLDSLSTLPGREVLARLDAAERAWLTEFLSGCRSGRGFTLDLRGAADVTAQVRQPVLVVATRTDGSVGFEHAEHLARTLPDARLVESSAVSHLLWIGPGAADLDRAVADFLG